MGSYEIQLFIKGLIIGVFTSAPVGPIGLLIIRRTANGGKSHGLISGLGASSADTFYATIAAFGLGFVLDYVVTHVLQFRMMGAVVLCLFGIWFILHTPKQQPLKRDASTYLAHYFTTMLFTLTNPITIFAFIGLFAAFGIQNPRAFTDPAYLIPGVFLGSMLWWLVVCLLCSRYREQLLHPNVQLINRIMGLIFCTTGLATLAFLYLSLR